LARPFAGQAPRFRLGIVVDLVTLPECICHVCDFSLLALAGATE